MAKKTIIFWRDIPSQVIVKQARTTAKAQLSERFLKAIDKAAMRAEFLEGWRREIKTCQGDPQTIVETTAKEMEDFYSDEVLQTLVKNKGLKNSD